ncbi:MAG: penicillin-binding protein [Anaerolineae bacterium]
MEVVRLRRAARRRRQNNSNILVKLVAATMLAVVLFAAMMFVAGVGSVFAVYAYFVKDLPAPEEIGRQTSQTFKTTTIYDRTGQTVLYEIFDPQWGNRTVVPLESIPIHLRQATIAIEDRNFYENPGINIRGIARAAYQNFFGSGPIQGGSSITQQLVKNVLIPPEERYQKSYIRKIKEAILALEISRRYSKDQILEMYLNTIDYGRLAYGVEAAAQAYFGKHVWDLDLAESAMIAALPQAPAANSPCENPEKGREKQHLVLDAMLREGYITAEETVAAKYEELECAQLQFDIVAPHFVFYVRKLLEEQFGPTAVYQGGLRVYTTIDLEMQRAAEEIARQQVAKLQEEERNVSNAAVVALRPSTGEILTMMGSLDYFNKEIDGQVNMAVANRQPGSAFKPFTYATAFEKGYTAATLVMDVRTVFPQLPGEPPYVPENYDRKYHGPQRFRQALARSYNLPAVKVLDMVGVKNVINTAHRLGITTLNRDYYGLSLTLGGGEVKPLDMAFAFATFANKGVMAGVPVPQDRLRPGYRRLDPVAILRVEDANGNLLYEFKGPEMQEVMSPQVAYLITDVLSDNQSRAAAFGANSMLKLSRPAAVKTGTTNDWRDAWTIGYTPQLVTAVWVGNADNEPMEQVPGSRGAAPIWHDFMEKVLAPWPVEHFERPDGFEEAEVCAISGLLPTEYCPNVVKEIFIKGTVPTTYDNVYQAFRICKPSGKLATVYCPPDQVETKVFEIYPAEAADWVRENEIPQPPTEYDTTYGPEWAGGEVAITSPEPYTYVRDQVPIHGNAKSPDLELYRLEYGQGLDPSAWIQIGGDHHYPVDNGLLETWDVSQLNGLYTLQLTVVERNQNYKRATIQVTVDNTPPTVEITHPDDQDIYVMEDDEWVNIQADAVDNFSMDRVEFYLDDSLIAYSTVAPYNRKWTIVMSDTVPVLGPPVVTEELVTNPDGTTTTEEVVVSEVVEEPDGTLIQRFSNGMSIISSTVGYTETHRIHVLAIDAAGNETESERVTIRVIHKEEEEEEGETSAIWLEDERTLLRREERFSLES